MDRTHTAERKTVLTKKGKNTHPLSPHTALSIPPPRPRPVVRHPRQRRRPRGRIHPGHAPAVGDRGGALSIIGGYVVARGLGFVPLPQVGIVPPQQGGEDGHEEEAESRHAGAEGGAWVNRMGGGGRWLGRVCVVDAAHLALARQAHRQAAARAPNPPGTQERRDAHRRGHQKREGWRSQEQQHTRAPHAPVGPHIAAYGGEGEVAVCVGRSAREVGGKKSAKR